MHVLIVILKQITAMHDLFVLMCLISFLVYISYKCNRTSVTYLGSQSDKREG